VFNYWYFVLTVWTAFLTVLWHYRRRDMKSIHNHPVKTTLYILFTFLKNLLFIGSHQAWQELCNWFTFNNKIFELSVVNKKLCAGKTICNCNWQNVQWEMTPINLHKSTEISKFAYSLNVTATDHLSTPVLSESKMRMHGLQHKHTRNMSQKPTLCSNLTMTLY